MPSCLHPEAIHPIGKRLVTGKSHEHRCPRLVSVRFVEHATKVVAGDRREDLAQVEAFAKGATQDRVYSVRGLNGQQRIANILGRQCSVSRPD